MDLGCGKGADLLKFARSGISGYVGIDISMGQHIDALNRRVQKAIRDEDDRKDKKKRNRNRRQWRKEINFPTLFIKEVGQAPPERFARPLPKDLKFDIISAQFCIHYFFDCEHSVRNFLQNVSGNLAKGGLFISTFPDSQVIAKKFLESGQIEPQNGMRYIENQHFSIVTTIKDFGHLQSAFGNEYGFFLDDGLIGDRKVVNGVTHRRHVPEFVIISEHFVNLAREYDLEPVVDQNFHEFFAEQVQDSQYRDQLTRKYFRRFGQSEQIMDPDLWECSYIYKLLIFRKTTGQNIDFSQNKTFEKPDFWSIVDNEQTANSQNGNFN